MPAPNLRYEGGPRHGETDWIDRPAVTLGDGSDGGIYHRTEETDAALAIYRWQPLTDSEANAIIRGDLRANQR